MKKKLGFEHYTRILFRNAMIAQQKKTVKHFSLTAEQRYLDLIAQNKAVLQRIPQKHIASYLGITPEFLSQLRKKITSH